MKLLKKFGRDIVDFLIWLENGGAPLSTCRFGHGKREHGK